MARAGPTDDDNSAWELAADRRLLSEVGSLLDASARLAGEWLACRLGCTECCVGPFPISWLDARRLRRGLAALEEQDPPLARALRGRAQKAIEVLSPTFPATSDGRLTDDEPARDRFFTEHEALPCPALDFPI